MNHAEPMTGSERRAYALGKRCFERGDSDTGLTVLTGLIGTRSFADVHYMMGVMHERKDDLAAASRSLREALRINPAYTEAMLALANIYERQGDYDRSREIAQRASVLARPTDGVLDATTRGKLANLQAQLGDAYRDVGELREAIEAYGKALERCPNFHDIRHRLGVALRNAGLPDRAIAEFKRVLRNHPSYYDSAIQLGLTYYSLGRVVDASAEWKAVIAQHPNHADASMYLRMVNADRG